MLDFKRMSIEHAELFVMATPMSQFRKVIEEICEFFRAKTPEEKRKERADGGNTQAELIDGMSRASR